MTDILAACFLFCGFVSIFYVFYACTREDRNLFDLLCGSMFTVTNFAMFAQIIGGWFKPGVLLIITTISMCIINVTIVLYSLWKDSRAVFLHNAAARLKRRD